jgi:predicted ribosomally synthesized peptide with SipW-like signal peptide
MTAAAAIAGAAILALTAGLFTVSSLALFTDQETVGANTFSTGSVDLATSPTTAVVTMTGMLPGDEVTAPLTVTNSGSLDFRYAVSSVTTEDTLAAGLDLTIRTGVTTCDNANWDATGTVVYATGDLGSTGGINLIGDPTTGSQAGDRTLSASANEILCINVTLPSGASNSLMGLTTTATFTFDAEQTANNP